MDEQNNNEQENNIEELKKGVTETKAAVESSASLAKNAATGNVAGMAKDVAKLAANKKVRKKIIINLVANILAPFLIIVLLAVSILGIFNAVGETVNGILSAIGDFFTVDPKDDGAINITDDQINKIIQSIEDMGVSVQDLHLLGDYSANASEEQQDRELKKYIRKFYEAQVVTETPNYSHKKSGGGKTYGAVYIYRYDDSQNDKQRELYYVDYELMKEFQKKGDEAALNHFSIDESGNLVFAGEVKTVKETGTDKNKLSQDGPEEVSIQLRTMDYKSLISQYTTQMNFLIYLTMISQNPEFVSAVVDLIKDSRIEIMVMDNISIYQEIKTSEYTQHKKWTETVTVGAGDTKHDEERPRYSEKDVTEVEKITKTTVSPSPQITYVKTWFCEQGISYGTKQEGPTSTTSDPEKFEEPKPQGDGEWKTNGTKTTEIITESTAFQKMPSQKGLTYTLGERGDSTKYQLKQIPSPTFIGLMETKYRIPYSSREAEAGSNLVSGAEMLFFLLQKDPKLQNMELIMRYALNIYLGYEKYDVELDSSIFEIKDFTSTSGSSLGLANYLIQFSHDSKAPESSDGKYYLMYGDAAEGELGWPTIGNSDIQWGSHYQDFAVSGKVLEGTTEKEVGNVAEYVNAKLANGPTAKYTNEQIRNLQIYIEKKLVDSIGDNLASSYYDDVVNYTSGLNLSRQQLYALTAIKYNFGSLPVRNGKTFIEVYQEGAKLYEANSWQHNKYIWDNWWASLGGGAAGHIPARDAAFETYVKGIFDFSTSPAGTVFSRKYYIYYTKEQLAQFDYAPNKPITRTTANEQEIFTYEAGAGGSILEVADELHQQQTGWSYSVGGDLYWNDIEKSINNPNRVTCCATYVSSVLYVAGYFSESEINSCNYNSSNELYDFLKNAGWNEIKSYDDLEPGDIVFTDTDTPATSIGHVQIYAGDGLWYNAGNDNSIKGSAPESQGDWARNRFIAALRPK